MYFLTPFDPYAPNAYRVQDVFSAESMRPDYAHFALFVGESDDTHEHALLLVTPSLKHVPATALVAPWREASDLPSQMSWKLLAGPADAWDRFGVPNS